MKLWLLFGFRRQLLFLAVLPAMFMSAQALFAQVSPSEILNPDLKALEQSYFAQLKTINQSIVKTKFPFLFYLSRFVGLDPAQQAEADSRGLEFVRFQDRVLLKVTGNYNSAYDTLRLTQNERAAGTFRAVVLPILNLVTAALPEDLACDGIGFEISHHTRPPDRIYDYEGKEILVVVLDRGDAWALARAATDSERQEIVSRSKIFISGTEFGLSLTERDPLNVHALPHRQVRPAVCVPGRAVHAGGGSCHLRRCAAFAEGRGASTCGPHPYASRRRRSGRKVSITIGRSCQRGRGQVPLRRLCAARFRGLP